MTEPSELGATLKRLRTAKGMTQRELTAAAKVPHATIASLESGAQQSADVVKLRKLATALGCPLSELAGEEAAPTPAGETAAVLPDGTTWWSVEDLEPDNYRKTFTDDTIQEMAASIAEQGVLQPLLIRRRADNPDRATIIAGERRWRGASHAVLHGMVPTDFRLPCIVKEISAREAKLMQLVENLQREDVPPMEEAEGLAALVDGPDGLSVGEIATKIGKTPRYVQQRLALLRRLDPVVQDALRRGVINFKTARVLTQASPEQQRDLVREVEDQPLASRVSAERLHERITGGHIPVSRAIFNLEDYRGDIWENPENGQRYFTDKKLFKDMQAKAVVAKVEELKGEWAWAMAVESSGSIGWKLNEYEHCTARLRAGVIVHYDPYTGSVTIHDNLAARRPTADDEAAANRRAAERMADEAREKEVAAFRARLAQALATDPGAALVLLLVDHLGDGYQSTLLYVDHARGLPTPLFVQGGPLECLADLVQEANFLDKTRYLKSNGQAADAWARLVQRPGVEIRMAVERWIAGRISVHVSPAMSLHPILVALARKYRIAVPSCFNRGDQADLEDAVAAAPALALSAEEGGQGERDEEEGAPLAAIHSASIRLPQTLLSALGRALPQHEDYGGAEIVLYGPEETEDAVLLDASSHDDEYYIIGLVNNYNFALVKEEEARRADAVLRHWIASVAPELLPADTNPVRDEAA